jgi:hypothetical protein
MSGFERSTLRWTRTSFFIVLATGFFIGLQWLEMRSGGVDTHKLAEAASDASNAASDQADAAQQFSDTAEDINSGIAGAVEQLEMAANNAKASIKSTQDALRLEQRPWVFMSGIHMRPLKIGEALTVEYWLKNEGRTPAFPTKNGRLFMWMVGHEVKRLEDVKGTPTSKAGMLFPGIVYGPDTISSPNLMEEPYLAAYNAKPSTMWVYIYGRISYTDTFGKAHMTSFCSVANGTDFFGACPEGLWPTYAN